MELGPRPTCAAGSSIRWLRRVIGRGNSAGDARGDQAARQVGARGIAPPRRQRRQRDRARGGDRGDGRLVAADRAAGSSSRCSASRAFDAIGDVHSFGSPPPDDGSAFGSGWWSEVNTDLRSLRRRAGARPAVAGVLRRGQARALPAHAPARARPRRSRTRRSATASDTLGDIGWRPSARTTTSATRSSSPLRAPSACPTSPGRTGPPSSRSSKFAATGPAEPSLD